MHLIAKAEWMSLRFQDFKRVNDYNSSLFRICSQLNFCGEEVSNAIMLEKTLSTFHASNNSIALPEVSATNTHEPRKNIHRRGRSRGRCHFSQNSNLGHDNTRGHGRGHPYNHDCGQSNNNNHAP
uniref:Uncharacterized protein n=1 Tax=Lactuca sativa TaxID=4236 RepID=A0A9R1UJ92_LACSA|nr:hypothetical protein LSAT_V11C900486490 [Lactuca sativa]